MPDKVCKQKILPEGWEFFVQQPEGLDLGRYIKLYKQHSSQWELNMMSPIEYEKYLLKIPKCQRTKMSI